MIIILSAFVISVALTLFMSFQVAEMGLQQIFSLFLFFISVMGVSVELLKLPLGKRLIDDDSNKFVRWIFIRYDDDPYGKLFPRESLITAKGKAASIVWRLFIASLLNLAASLFVIWFA